MGGDMCARTDDGVINIRVGAIIVRDERVLMVKNARDAWYYSVGGRIKFGETAEQAVVREVFEETGVKMQVDRLGFISESYFHGTIGDPVERLIYEPCFYFYMRVPDGFEIRSASLTSDGLEERLEWIPFDTTKTIYPAFFKTELKSPGQGVKHIVCDER